MKPYPLLIILLLLNINVFAQNLVENGSFENHSDVQCMSCYKNEQFSSVMQGWSFKNWLSPYICNRKYGIYEHGICDLTKYSPKEGTTNMELVYFNSKSVKMGGCENEGYANYLETNLLKILEKDKIYIISASFNIIKKHHTPFSPNLQNI